jgi:hypothetical protein
MEGPFGHPARVSFRVLTCPHAGGPLQKQVTVSPSSPPPVINVWVVSPGQSRVVGALRGQAPSLVWQPVHFTGRASLHCAQHHFPAYTTPVHGNGRHRASSASESAIATPTHKSHIHRMAVPNGSA